MAPSLRPLRFRAGTLDWSRPYVMGVLNMTPDSFSDGGQLLAGSLPATVARAEAMVRAGADILDVGGESTRPGAALVSADAECERVLPLIEALRSAVSVPVSVDTTKASVARRAVAAGAEIVNDISGGRFDAEMLSTVDELGVAFVCGHVRGRSLDEVHACPSPSFDEVVTELAASLAGMPESLVLKTIVDPCIGFGKDLKTNLGLVRRAGELARALGRPVLVGPSRKRFLGEITGLPVGERDAATVGACLASVSGGAHILRVHDVAMMASALQVFCAAQEVAA
jgi:dihydropteroate synthase